MRRVSGCYKLRAQPKRDSGQKRKVRRDDGRPWTRVPHGQKRKRAEKDVSNKKKVQSDKPPQIYKNLQLAESLKDAPKKPVYKNLQIAESPKAQSKAKKQLLGKSQKAEKPKFKNLQIAESQKTVANGAQDDKGPNVESLKQEYRDNRPQNPLAARQKNLLQVRQSLPIWSQAANIRNALLENHVLILAGETGSGKSTQVPQFLHTSAWCTGRIAVTQPRRVAAVSLARRVAEEMGTPLGKSPQALVGYNVRFDDNVGKNNKVKFLTEGMLLQEMLRDPALVEYSCVVVDEVHERSVNVDLLLGFLRGLVTGTSEAAKKRKGKPLKVVVMSATADTEKLKDFFSEGFGEPRAEDNNPTVNDTMSLNKDKASVEKPQVPSASSSGKISTCFVEGRMYPVQTEYLSEPTRDFSEAALLQIFQIHRKEPMPGDILVFLTGGDVITNLQQAIEDMIPNVITRDSGLPKLLVLPLYAALSQAQQQAIFSPAPPNTRKVILATNIAETSITVPGVRFVIDSGKAKIKQFRNRLGLDSLLVKDISKSSAIQRQGRAGREAAGKCFRLYTKLNFEALEKDAVPEILRCDLSSAVLTMKARGVQDVMSFPLLTRPSREAMERALLLLLQLDALNPEDGNISELGRKIARLPLTPAHGRTIVAAADPEMGCLLPVIDIVACFNSENIFVEIKDQDANDEAREARNKLSRRQGDHLTLLSAVQAYASERTDRKQWAKQHLISHRSMQNVMDVRKQLRAQCQQAKLITKEELAAADDDLDTVSESTGNNILKCFLRGFPANVARLVPDGSYRTIQGHMAVAIHPSSVLYSRKLEAILYNEFVYTNRTYARSVSAIQMNWLEEVYAAPT
ncbi:putative ATP-dependent RNA helicase [Aureobasidium subglaciale]|nr:putative ATP-dependent RNA helicase [Aureobasidium subglaciale]